MQVCNGQVACMMLGPLHWQQTVVFRKPGLPWTNERGGITFGHWLLGLFAGNSTQ